LLEKYETELDEDEDSEVKEDDFSERKRRKKCLGESLSPFLQSQNDSEDASITEINRDDSENEGYAAFSEHEGCDNSGLYDDQALGIENLNEDIIEYGW
jgi:hypothetical protein